MRSGPRLNTPSASSPPRRTAQAIFEAELRKHGVKFSQEQGPNQYVVELGEASATVNLENVARNFTRDRDPKAVRAFAAQVLSHTGPPPWKEARSLVRWSVERSDHDFGQAIHERVTETVSRVLVITDAGERKISWLLPESIASWRVSPEKVKEAAAKNLSRLLAGKRVEIGLVNGLRLGMVPVPSAFKASVIFASDFKEFVATDLGWPVLAVIPCRDFIYLMAEKDKELLDRMGKVVQREFHQSGHPITTEVLRVSDQGIKAIGAFPTAIENQ